MDSTVLDRNSLDSQQVGGFRGFAEFVNYTINFNELRLVQLDDLGSMKTII